MPPSATSLPVVAIVGRPNVGKSTLFNRLVGERLAIVEDIPGTTRDRVYGTAEWNGRRFTVVDTGGLELEPGTDIEARVQDQARVAIEEADVILFVVDAAAGLAPGAQVVVQIDPTTGDAAAIEQALAVHPRERLLDRHVERRRADAAGARAKDAGAHRPPRPGRRARLTPGP